MPDASSHERPDEIARLLIRVYEIHEVIIDETGGQHGLRDALMLHSAVARPFATFDGEELYPTDFEKVAALFHSLIKNHPFLDGTKRTALAAALYFLESCGYPIPEILPLSTVVEFCVSVAEENSLLARSERHGRLSISEIAKWFRTLLEPASS